MKILQMLKNKTTQITDQDYNKKKYILKFLSMKDVHVIELEYYGKELKFYFLDENKIERSRPSSRSELTEAISLDVPIEMILDKFPELDKTLK